MARSYVTLAPELLESADMAFDHYEEEGFRVSVEHRDLYYPNTPTLTCKKRSTEHIIEVAASVDSARFADWVHYGRARGKETFVSLVLPDGADASVSELATLRAKGIGVFSAGAGGLTALVEPTDLSTSVGLPDLSKERPIVRRLLKGPFKKISDGATVDGFKDASAAFEEIARSHFIAGVKSTRIQLVTKQGKPRSLTEAQIKRLTLGQLGVAFSEIIAPTQADDLARRAIESMLKDRNDATHNATQPAVARRVKRNVARHVFAILNALREIA